MIAVTQLYDDTTKDLLFAILKALGGTMQDIKPLYFDSRDDLLYAILERLASGRSLQEVDVFTVAVTNNNRSMLNYPTIIGATGVLVSIGGLFIDAQNRGGRYFLADLVNGSIDMPPMAVDETVIILKF